MAIMVEISGQTLSLTTALEVQTAITLGFNQMVTYYTINRAHKRFHLIS